ncbi:MAG: U32 family peptidase C-terminal domain-containing protein [Patescibacteria group bacterium]|nr:U32 family peptidase C-terminal domain-containing protein [Patescibacteria group bacterium]
MIKKEKNKSLELLAPAGSLEKMKTALAFGADAVYAGIPDFSLRVRVNDFDLEKIKEAAEYCHERNKKIYITVNIFAHNYHINKLPKYIKELKRIKTDALIISDPGILRIVKNIWPECVIHLSTQANCTNWQSAKFWFEQGVNRIILGREVTLNEIKEIHKRVSKLELEYFVHGAMCMAYSGRCFLSKYYLDKSANLGDCVQPCRWKYSVARNKKKLENSIDIFAENHEKDVFEVIEEEHGSYILNSKDLCLIKHLRELADAGISSFKIEGRAKSAYYQAVVAGIYSHIIYNLKLTTHNSQLITQKKIDYFYDELYTKLVHRGYTTGFLLGEKADQNLGNSHETSGWEFCGQVVSSIKNYELHPSSEYKQITNYKEEKAVFIKVHNCIKLGDKIEIVIPKYDIISMTVEKMLDAETGEEIKEAHGGQGRVVIMEVDGEVPEYSVVRRRL